MSFNKIWFIIITLLVFFNACKSRDHSGIRPLPLKDSLLIRELHDKCNQIQISEPDSGLAIQQQLRTIYRHYGNKKGVIQTYNTNSNIYCLYKGDLKNGKRYADSAIAFAMLPGNENLLYIAYFSYGTYHKCLGDFDSSVYYFLEALNIQPEEKDQIFYENTYNQLADLFVLQENYYSAFKYYQPLIEKANRESNTNLSVGLYMGAYFYGILVPGNDSLAFSYLQLAVKTAKRNNYTVLDVALNFYMAEYYNKQNQLDSSIRYALESIYLIDTAPTPFDQYEKPYSILIDNYIKKGQYLDAKETLLKAERKINSNIIARKDKIKLLGLKYKIDSNYGDSKTAYLTLQQLNRLEKEDFAESKKEQLFKHERELKKLAAEKPIASKDAALRKQSLVNKVMLSVSVLLAIILVLIILFLQKRKKLAALHLSQVKQEAELAQEKALLQQQKEERNRIAQEMHDDLGSSLTTMFMGIQLLEKDPENKQHLGLIDRASQQLSRQIGDVVWNLNLRNDHFFALVDYFTRYAQEFLGNAQINITIDSDRIKEDFALNAMHRRAIYLSLKELLNNIVKYAEAKNVSVVFEQNDDCLIIKVKDDGIGIEQHRQNLKTNKRGGNGLKNIQQIIEQIQGSVIWKDENGTEVMISLPFKILNND